MKGAEPTVWRRMEPSQVGMRKENTNVAADWNFPRQDGIKAMRKD